MTPVAQPTPRRDIDPRGIHRKQVRVLVDPNGGTTLVEFECGHISEMAQHFTYKVGDVRFCFKCGKEALACNSFDALTDFVRSVAEYDRYDGYDESEPELETLRRVVADIENRAKQLVATLTVRS